jgi:2-oxoglutarate ferredoxin oxidoreductase subunit gamma
MTISILLSGFGGQGVMSAGKFLAYAALRENRYAIFLPSYGAEVRGGTAHCSVKISDTMVLSPLIVQPDVAIMLNQPSLDKFEKSLVNKGLLILNSDLIQKPPKRHDIKVVSLPLNAIAIECGNIKTANVIALGVLLKQKPGLFKKETLTTLIKEMPLSRELVSQNLIALDKGLAT